MKKLCLLIYHFFKGLLQPKPETGEHSFPQKLSQSVYRTAAEKSEPEEKKPTPSDSFPITAENPLSLSNLFLQRKSGFSSLTSSHSLFEPLPPLPSLPSLKPLAPLKPLPPLPPLKTLPPLKIHRTDNYSPIKNFNTKQIIQIKQVSREDALRASNLPLTNDMSEIGDDTIKVPTQSGQSLYITPESFMVDKNYKTMEQSKEDE